MVVPRPPRHVLCRALLLLPAIVRAQDPFEIHVYEYETLARGRYTLEAHLNYVGIGSRTAERPLAPTNDQFHMTYELTAGITPQTSLGFMFLTGRRVDNGLEYAGWRLLPHFYIPKSWGLPFDAGLVTEFSFQRTIYEENSRRVEIRPIIEKRLGRVQIDLNPVFVRALHGPGTQRGWGFEPAGRICLRHRPPIHTESRILHRAGLAANTVADPCTGS